MPIVTLLIYETHVKGITYDATSGVKDPGTFSAIMEKIPYFKELGITALELLPIHPFDQENNYWGYASTDFLSLHPPYGTPEDLKALATALHKEGIKLIIDVVYNHTGTHNPNLDYFDEDFTGCGNSVSCNTKRSMAHILKSLEMLRELGVDGFRFDLASVMTREPSGAPLTNPPLIRAIERDFPDAILIAEAWDVGGLYQVGNFPSKLFAEWNGAFRDRVRRFIKGDDNASIPFMEVMTGSHYLYGDDRLPKHSINFVTAHDGFTLTDLVSYNYKHNEANGEDNQDGADHNDSWNCGVEGPTDDPQINELREKQIHNFLTALFLSVGTPMMLMGDEYGRTRHGNNNPWCQDAPFNYFKWDQPVNPWVKALIALRKHFPFLDGETYPETELIQHDGKLIVFRIHTLFYAFNASHERREISLPEPMERLVDTGLADLEGLIREQVEHNYSLAPYSSMVAKIIPS